MTREQLEKIAKQSAKEREKKRTKTLEEAIAEAEVLDKERAKRKKIKTGPTKEEKAQELIKKMLGYDEPKSEEPKKVVIKKKNPDDWDVKIGDPIEYFDPTLSYELTGYRPITETEGLDFDPKPFTVAADTYRQTGKYTSLLPGTFAHRQFWMEEFRKCRNGVTIGRYTLTGKNYFFLNYYRLLSVFGTTTGEEIRQEDFPGFLAKQYEYFHYIELCEKAGFDILAFKARGVGASEIAASNCAHEYTFHKASYSIVSAFDEKYVAQTLNKVWQELDFLNTCTQGGFRRVRMKIDTAFKKRASKVDKDKNESGWMSTIEGVTVDNPRKLRGNRINNLYMEESGSNACLIDTYVQGRALVFVGGSFRVGRRCVFGTAGDATPNLQGLKTMLYNPEDYTILPYKHNYTRTGETVFTGYYIPAQTIWFGDKDHLGFDSRGVTNEKVALEYYHKRWDNMSDPKLRIKDMAEYCTCLEDAFTLEGGDVFNTEKLVEQQVNIQQLKVVEPPKRIKLTWDYNKELGGVDRNSMPKAEFSEHGKILITELPMTDEKGVPFTNLYCAGCDAIDTDKNTSTGQTDVSKFCITIMRRQVGLKAPKIVALYIDRPNDIREAWDNALKLCQFYNAKMLVEATKIGVINHFINNQKQYYLMKRPSVTLTTSKQNKRQYGVPAVTSIIEHQIELIQEYVEDFYDQIDYLEVIDQLIRYSFENKRKFDIVAGLGMALLANEDMQGKTPKLDNSGDRKLDNIGYYTNEYGQKVFGVIKETTQSTMRYGWFRET